MRVCTHTPPSQQLSIASLKSPTPTVPRKKNLDISQQSLKIPYIMSTHTYPANFAGQNWGNFPTPGAARQQVNLVKQNLFPSSSRYDTAAAATTIPTKVTGMRPAPTTYPPLPPVEVLQHWFFYEPDLGLLLVRNQRRGGKPKGTPAGGTSRGTNPRRRVQLDGVQHLEERIAYALGHNTDLQPTDTIIHLNGDRSDNRLSNLSLESNHE
jgi:hypothetical protein